MGYPESTRMVWPEEIDRFKTLFSINVGDTFKEVYDHPNTGKLERSILFHFADLWNLDRANTWGYLANGSSEAVMFGGYMAKKYFKEVKNYNKKPAVALI